MSLAASSREKIRDLLRFDLELIKNECRKPRRSAMSSAEIIVLHHVAILRYHRRNASRLFANISWSYALNDRSVSPSTVIYRSPLDREEMEEMLVQQKKQLSGFWCVSSLDSIDRSKDGISLYWLWERAEFDDDYPCSESTFLFPRSLLWQPRFSIHDIK